MSHSVVSSPTIISQLLPFSTDNSNNSNTDSSSSSNNNIGNLNESNNGSRSRGNSGSNNSRINTVLQSGNTSNNNSPNNSLHYNNNNSNNNSPLSNGVVTGRKRSHSDLTASFLEAQSSMDFINNNSINNKNNNNNNNINNNSNNNNTSPSSSLSHDMIQYKSLLPPIPFIPLSPNKSNTNNSGNNSTISYTSIINEEMFKFNTEIDCSNKKEDRSISNSNNSSEEIYLPIDVLDLIFSQLSFIDRCTCASVCSSWRNVLLMQPHPLLENCFVSLHNQPPTQSVPIITPLLLNNFNITISPCSCHKCYYTNPTYKYLSNWMEYLKPFYSVVKLNKLVFRVFQNSTDMSSSSSPSSPSSNNTTTTTTTTTSSSSSHSAGSTNNTNNNNNNNDGLLSPFPSSPMPTFPEFSISQINSNNNSNNSNNGRTNHFLHQSPFLTGLRNSGEHQHIHNHHHHHHNHYNYHQQQQQQPQQPQQQQQQLQPPQPQHSPLVSISSPSSASLAASSIQYTGDQQLELLSNCECYEKISKESMSLDGNYSQLYLDLEKPLTLPLKDRGASIPLSTLIQVLDNSQRVERIKMRVCIDLPWSKTKEIPLFKPIKNAEKLTEIGLLNHDPSDTSMSSAQTTTSNINSLIFSTLFFNPSSFVNLKRLYLITTTIDHKFLFNLKLHLPSLTGLHLSVWNVNVLGLFEMITSIYGDSLKELSIRFTTCLGIKYTPFSHTEYKLDDSMVELLVSKCPNLQHFSFEGWLSNISSKSFQLLSKLKLKHLVLKNGPYSQTSCKPIWARVKMESTENPYQSLLVSEQEIKDFVRSQRNLKVFEIYTPQIDKFTSKDFLNNLEILDINQGSTGGSSSSSNSTSLTTINNNNNNNSNGSPDLPFEYDSLNSYLTNLQNLQKHVAFSHQQESLNSLSDDLITNFVESCPNLKYLKIVDRLNFRSHIRGGNRNKYHRSKLPSFNKQSQCNKH
ncbi:hypothetical protein ACTFIU_010597 [Dictyostelium citrinum]